MTRRTKTWIIAAAVLLVYVVAAIVVGRVLGISGGQAWVLRHSRGRIRRSFLLAGGQPVLSLTTTGRRSGQSHSTTVAYLPEGDTLVLAAINLGNERAPAWALNLAANPAAEVVVDGTRIPVRARRADGAERDRLWGAWVRRLPSAETFALISGREIPVFVLERAG